MNLSTFSRAKAAVLSALLAISSIGNGLGQPAVSTNGPPAPGSLDAPAFLPGEVLVQFKADVTDDQIAGAFRGAGLEFVKQLQTRAMQRKGDIGITRALTRMPVEQAVAVLRRLPGIEYAEPNWVYQHQATSDDPYFTSGALWGMYGNLSTPMNVYGSQAAEAWATAVGSRSVVVGIIDEGVQITHPDLAANIWTNPGEIPGNGIDDDGNGYVDDINGWDFYENNNTVYDGTSDDHATHVAGAIGAIGGNKLGVVGVNWEVSMIPGKFLGPKGGTTLDAIEAVDYFTDLKVEKGVNVVVLNNSWGGGGYSQGLHDSIIRAAKAGILFVAAAGNGDRVGRAINNDLTPYYPACYNTTVGTSTETAASYDAVIAVTAIDANGYKASWANYGLTTVDLGAPGVGINSTLPVDTYGSYSGTSMATPHVTGAIALLASVQPAATPANIRAAILGSVASTPSLVGKTVTGGRLDLSTVIQPTNTPEHPDAPGDFVATGINASQIRLTWTDNSNNETRFEIVRDGSTTITVGANSTSYTDSGLAAETTHTYQIKACNAGGCSELITAGAKTLEFADATAVFVGIDATTQGNWIGNYGAEGYDIVRCKVEPSYGSVRVVDDYKPEGWLSDTPAAGDVRPLRKPDDPASRFTACYFDLDNFYFDVNLDNAKHRVSLYCLDWDQITRIESIEIIDPYSGKSLHKIDRLDSFELGKYLTWDISGHVHIKVTWIDSPYCTYDNAVVSGIFFDPVPAPPPVQIEVTAPEEGATVKETVTITAQVTATVSVTKAEFFARLENTETDLPIGSDQEGSDGWSCSWNTTSFSDGAYTLWAVATTDRGEYKSSKVNVTVANETPVLTEMYCADLQGVATSSGANWKATVTVTIKDDKDQLVSDATVTGSWSGGHTGTATGTTTSSGTVSFATPLLSKKKVSSVTFTVNKVTREGWTYNPAKNVETTITISKP